MEVIFSKKVTLRKTVNKLLLFSIIRQITWDGRMLPADSSLPQKCHPMCHLTGYTNIFGLRCDGFACIPVHDVVFVKLGDAKERGRLESQ